MGMADSVWYARRRSPSGLYAWISQRLGCEFVNAGEIVEYDLADGIHLGATGHAAFGRYLASWLRSHFEGAQS